MEKFFYRNFAYSRFIANIMFDAKTWVLYLDKAAFTLIARRMKIGKMKIVHFKREKNDERTAWIII